MKTILIIGSGVGGMAAGIYGQRAGFQTEIFEMHSIPGGQCTGWKRRGYTFDGCIHHFGAGSSGTLFEKIWRELGVLPHEMIATREVVKIQDSKGNQFHDYFDLKLLKENLLNMSPQDKPVIEQYIKGIKAFSKGDIMGKLFLGNAWQRITALPQLIGKTKYFKHTLGSYSSKFSHPFLKKAFALLHSSLPGFPLFMHLLKHIYALKGDVAWVKGGALSVANNMAETYKQEGGILHLKKPVRRIITEEDRAVGLELADGTIQRGDIIISNADGRKTIQQLLENRYRDEYTDTCCIPPGDDPQPWAVTVYLGVNRDLTSCPAAMVLMLDEEQKIAGEKCSHLDLQIYGFDPTMAPEGKGVIKVELFSRPSYFQRFKDDKEGYNREKQRIAQQVIKLLEGEFPQLGDQVEVIDVATLSSWERYMGGTQGYNNYPNHKDGIAQMILGINKRETLPGLKNFYFTGTWVTAAGALLMNALSGKKTIKKICRNHGKPKRRGSHVQ